MKAYVVTITAEATVIVREQNKDYAVKQAGDLLKSKFQGAEITEIKVIEVGEYENVHGRNSSN